MIKLYINDTNIDLYEGQEGKIAITFSIADINDIEGRSSGSSKTIAIPLTDRNRATFGYPDDIDSSTSIDQNTSFAARIEADGQDVIRGFAKITKVRIRPEGDEVELVIIGDNGDWKSQAAEDKLEDMDWSDSDHSFTASNITAAWVAPQTYDYNYPLVDYGRLINANEVSVGDLRPAVKVRSVLYKIFNEKGYDISSAFFDTDFAAYLYIVGGRNNVLDDSFRTNRSFNAGLASDFTITLAENPVPLADLSGTGNFQSPNSNFGSPNYTYVADAYSVERFTFDYHFSLTVGTLPITSYIELFIYHYRSGVKINTSYKQQEYYYDVVKGSLTTGYWQLQPGDRIYVSVKHAALSVSLPATLTLYDSVDTSFYNEVTLWMAEGNTVDLSKHVPDISQIDFIKAIKHLFNLYFYTDVAARVVYIEPRDDFYNDKSDAIDWSTKLDTGDDLDIEYITPEAKYMLFGYKEDDSDINLVNYAKRNTLPFGAYRHENSNKFAEGEKGITNEVFAATWMDFRPKLGFSHQRIPIIIKEDSDGTIQDFECTPRMLHYAGLTTIKGVWKFAGVSRGTFPKFDFTDYRVSNNNSLSFTNYDMANGLFAKHYTNQVYLQTYSRLVSGSFYLTPLDIAGIDFRDMVLVDGTYYYLNKVSDYAPGRKMLTVVELVKVVNKQTVSEASSTNIVPPPNGKASGEERYVGVMIQDTRVRPANIVPVMVQDEDGVLSEVYIKLEGR